MSFALENTLEHALLKVYMPLLFKANNTVLSRSTSI